MDGLLQCCNIIVARQFAFRKTDTQSRSIASDIVTILVQACIEVLQIGRRQYGRQVARKSTLLINVRW